MPSDSQPPAPSLSWRASSSFIIGTAGLVCRSFLFGANRMEVNGLENFLKLLDERADVAKRERGLITVSNHLSVLDDPLMWGVLPLRYLSNQDNMRWALGSYDIVFKNSMLSRFFTLGQVLPTHRLAHSLHGGLFQPTITQTIRLLSRHPFTQTPSPTSTSTSPIPTSHPTAPPIDLPNPFTDSLLTYTTNKIDTFPSPSAYATRRHAWIHIYPEGRTHQRSDKTMRYFKWGIARLILESEPAPAIVPIWIEGFDSIMHESRVFPRFLPRVGNDVSVTFGGVVDGEGAFGDLRGRWRELVERERRRVREMGEGEGEGEEGGGVVGMEMGVVESEVLRYGDEARKLREECVLRVREAVLNVRKARGLPDEDPKVGLVETWREEGVKREGKMDDGSWVKDT